MEMECNFQKRASEEEIHFVYTEIGCRHCGLEVSELAKQGRHLELCGEEYGTDLVTGEKVLTPIGLCNECHRLHHQDAKRQHNPCQIKARLSREGLD